MDAVLAGGVCGEAFLGADRRLDQQDERMQEALQLVSGTTAHLRRRLRAMELKMESTHGEASAAAAALRHQVARMERLEDKMAAVERRLRRANGRRGDGDDDDDKMAAIERLLRRAAGLDTDSHGADDSSEPSAPGVDEYPACPGCRTSSSSSALSGTSRASSAADDDDVVPDASLLHSIAQIVSLVPGENMPPARTSLKRHHCGIRLEIRRSPYLPSTAADDAPKTKIARLDSTAQTGPNLSLKQTSSTRSSFSHHLCGAFCDASASSNGAIAIPNQKTSRLDCNIQTVPIVSEEHVHSARHRCVPVLDSLSASITVSDCLPGQKTSRLDATAQTSPLVPDKHRSPTPTSLPRRLCERLLDSLSVPVTTDAALRNPRRLNSTSQTVSTVFDKNQGNPLTCFGSQSQLSQSLESSTTAHSASFPNVLRLDSNAQVPLVFDKCTPSARSTSCDLSSPLSNAASKSASSETPKASRSNVAAQIPENHISPDDTPLSRGLYQVLRSAAAMAASPFLSSVEPISRLTPSNVNRADTDERLGLSSEQSHPDGSTTSSPSCDVASKSRTCGCPEAISCPRLASVCTQTDECLGSCGYSLQAPGSGLLCTACHVASEAEDCRNSLSRRSSSLACHCPSTAGERKSVSGYYTSDKVSRSTSCATFSNTNIASSSGFYDYEGDSQSSSISDDDEPSQCSSFYPFSERITQHVVWMSSPYNPSLYYCVPLINSSFCTISCNEDASNMPTVSPDSFWSVSNSQSCIPLCDVAPSVLSVTKESKSSSEPRAISYAPLSSKTTLATPSSSVTNCSTACGLKPTHTEQSTITPDAPISFSERNSSPPTVNVSPPISIAGKPQTVIESSDCLIPTPRPPSSPGLLTREGHPEEIPRSPPRARKSESSCSLLSSCYASRPTSCGLSTHVTPSCSSNVDSSKNSSESKLHSTSTPTLPLSQSTSLVRVTPPSEEVSSSSAPSVTKNIQDTTCDGPSICSPDVSLSISQPTTHSRSLYDTSLASDSPPSNINARVNQSEPTPLDDVTVSKSNLHSSCSPDIVPICRSSSSSDSLNPIKRVTSGLNNGDVKYQILSRPSSPEIPPAPPPTPLSQVSNQTISRSTTSIHSNVATPRSSTFKAASQPPSDGCFPDKAADHKSSDVRQFSSKTVILPKDVIHPRIPHIESPVLRPFSGCATIKECNRPLSGNPLRKGISETTFVIESPKSTSRPCVSSRPTHRPNSSSTAAGDVSRRASSVRKLISEATFVVDSPKLMARPTVSCDDSQLARRSIKFTAPVTVRGAGPKAASKPPHSVVSVMDLPTYARAALPVRARAAAAPVPLRARPPPSRVKVARARSAEVKLGRRLLQAAQEGRAPAVRKLLDEGADVNFTFATKWTALHRAVKMGHEEVVCVLLAGGADVEAKTTYNFTALHIAAYYDHKGLCLARLIDAGSDLGSRNRSGKTPLHYASEVGNKMAVRALVVAGANTASLDDNGKTPYDVAKVSDVRGLLASAGRRGKLS